MDLKKSTIAVAETFYSIQGEGMSMGRPAVFLRLAGCNLMCGGEGTQHDGQLHDGATWRCDTIESWMKGRARAVQVVFKPEYLEALKDGARLILTGGEPLLQQEQFSLLKRHLATLGIHPYVEIETNGTLMPRIDLFDQFNVSPKLSNSGMPKDRRICSDVLMVLSGLHTQFKFVVSHHEDWLEIEQDFGSIPREKIWLMPAGESREDLKITRPIAVTMAKQHRVNFSDRLHINIWDRKTGV